MSDRSVFAVCVGHSRPGDQGADSCDGRSEHQYNSDLGAMVVDGLTAAKVPAILVDDYEGKSYGAAMRWLRGHLMTANAAGAVELHFNSAESPQANGHEWLYWAGSERGRVLAKLMELEVVEEFGDRLKRRGLKAATASMRGGGFLGGVHCPAVIAEPFFGSNGSDRRIATAEKEELAAAMARGIAAWWKGAIG